MEQDFISLQEEKIERSIINIGVQVAYIIEVAQRIKELSENSEKLLVTAQIELEELYLALSESKGDFKDISG